MKSMMYGAVLYEYKTNMCDKYLEIVVKTFALKHEYCYVKMFLSICKKI